MTQCRHPGGWVMVALLAPQRAIRTKLSGDTTINCRLPNAQQSGRQQLVSFGGAHGLIDGLSLHISPLLDFVFFSQLH